MAVPAVVPNPVLLFSRVLSAADIKPFAAAVATAVPALLLTAASKISMFPFRSLISTTSVPSGFFKFKLLVVFICNLLIDMFSVHPKSCYELPTTTRIVGRPSRYTYKRTHTTGGRA
ncbi:hypothetical protein D3C75_1195120 [compost metagenome]